MNYISLLDQCKEYIREHLANDISARELADHCGYSLYHLSSVFRACFGCSVGRYILEEKLRFAALWILEGRKVSDVAVDMGFDTASGFAKAFKRIYGCSPREFRKNTNETHHASLMRSERKHDAMDSHGHSISHAVAHSPVMQPEYVKRTAVNANGYIIPVSEEDEQSGQAAFWAQVDFKALPSYPDDAADYGEVGVWMNPHPESGKMDYFFGYITSNSQSSEGFANISLGEGEYVVFRLIYPSLLSEVPEQLQAHWQYIFKDWFAGQAALEFDDSRLCFEKYGTDEIEIRIPVKRNKRAVYFM